MPTGQRAAVASIRDLVGLLGTIRGYPPVAPPYRGVSAIHAPEGPAPRRPARLASAPRLARLGRPLRGALDPSQDRRPGRARERGAARTVRGAVAADLLADRRLAREARLSTREGVGSVQEAEIPLRPGDDEHWPADWIDGLGPR